VPGPKDQSVAELTLVFLAKIDVVLEIEVRTALRILDDHTASVGTFSFLAVTHFTRQNSRSRYTLGLWQAQRVDMEFRPPEVLKWKVLKKELHSKTGSLTQF